MAATLTKKERILRTMACQETDRVPLYDLLFCDGAIEHFSGEKLPPRVYEPWAMQEADRITGRAICNFLDRTRAWNFGPIVDREYTNEYGFIIHESTWEKTSWVQKRPFDDLAGAKNFMKRWMADTEADTRQIEAFCRLAAAASARLSEAGFMGFLGRGGLRDERLVLG